MRLVQWRIHRPGGRNYRFCRSAATTKSTADHTIRQHRKGECPCLQSIVLSMYRSYLCAIWLFVREESNKVTEINDCQIVRRSDLRAVRNDWCGDGVCTGARIARAARRTAGLLRSGYPQRAGCHRWRRSATSTRCRNRSACADVAGVPKSRTTCRILRLSRSHIHGREQQANFMNQLFQSGNWANTSRRPA